MNILMWVIMVLLILVVVLLLINGRFNLVGKYKEIKKDQKKYKQLHEKYKKLLNK